MSLKLLKVADVREILDKYNREEISYTKMVELLNERANERLMLCDIIERSEQLCDLNGKTVRVKFKVTKYIPKIVIEDI